jgi:hypothetical protein
MDIERLKEEWNEVEERDGVRLSWNVFPSSRMVRMGIHIRDFECSHLARKRRD